MINLKIYGRIFYGIGIAGIGLMHFFHPGFRRLIAPIPAESTANISYLIYALAFGLLVSGVLISLGKWVERVSLILGYVFLLFLLFAHLPVRLQQHPGILAYWTNTIKIMALAGGAFVLSLEFLHETPSPFFDKLAKIEPAGKYLFAAMLLIFGFGHFKNAVPISGLVPKYIPLKLFWTYLGGVALAGSGIAIVINFRRRAICLLLAAVLFIWLISLHIYYTVRFPEWNEGENFMGSFVCLAFCGIALLISQQESIKPNKQ